jgi:hypothetical protein
MVLFRDSQAVRGDGALEAAATGVHSRFCSRGPSMMGAACAGTYPAVIDGGDHRKVPVVDGTRNAVPCLHLGTSQTGWTRVQ